MKMSEDDSQHIQFDMYLITIDDTPNCPLMICAGGYTKKEDTEDWVRSVNLIYRCLHCGLWTADRHELSWLSKEGLNNYSLCKKLSVTIQYWMGVLLCNTNFGQSFVEGFDIKNLEGDVYPPFIEALEELFRKNGVPWEAGDLFDMRSRLG